MSALVLLTPLLPLLLALPGAGAWAAWALPFVAPLTLYPAFRRRVLARDYLGAWSLGLAWAFLLSAGVIALVFFFPAEAREGTLHGEPYRQEMFGWIATGVGPENQPAAFIPQHLLHLAVFLVLTYVSGGYLGLALGAALVGYMSYFVGHYAAVSGHLLLGSVAAWVPWSVLRVMAFVLLGAVFSRPLLTRRVWPFESLERRLMLLAATGILADVLMKSLLAPAYGRFLRGLVAGALAALTAITPF